MDDHLGVIPQADSLVAGGGWYPRLSWPHCATGSIIEGCWYCGHCSHTPSLWWFVVIVHSIIDGGVVVGSCYYSILDVVPLLVTLVT